MNWLGRVLAYQRKQGCCYTMSFLAVLVMGGPWGEVVFTPAVSALGHPFTVILRLARITSVAFFDLERPLKLTAKLVQHAEADLK